MPVNKRPTHKMLSFARAILSGLPPSQALEASAYNTTDWGNDKAKSVFAQELLNHPLIADAIATAQAETFSDAIMTRQESIERLTAVGRASLSELVDFRTIKVVDKYGHTHHQAIWAFKDSDEMRPDQLAAISELTASADGSFKIKLRDADKAQAQLAKLQGWAAAPKAAVGPDGEPAITTAVVMSADEYKAMRAKILEEDDC